MSNTNPLRRALSAAKQKFYERRGEPYRIAGHCLRFVSGTKPVRLSMVTSNNIVARYGALQLKTLVETLREGDRALDIGAFAGEHTIVMAALCGRTGEVVAFEPSPYSRERILQNIALNPKLKPPVVEASAVSEFDGHATLHMRSDSGPESSLADTSLDGASLTVETVSIDRYLLDHPGKPPRLVKIDVEGAEIGLLRGAQSILMSAAIILCELHPNAWPLFGDTFSELQALVAASGRQIRFLGESGPCDQADYGIVALDRLT